MTALPFHLAPRNSLTARLRAFPRRGTACRAPTLSGVPHKNRAVFPEKQGGCFTPPYKAHPIASFRITPYHEFGGQIPPL